MGGMRGIPARTAQPLVRIGAAGGTDNRIVVSRSQADSTDKGIGSHAISA